MTDIERITEENERLKKKNAILLKELELLQKPEQFEAMETKVYAETLLDIAHAKVRYWESVMFVQSELLKELEADDDT